MAKNKAAENIGPASLPPWKYKGKAINRADGQKGMKKYRITVQWEYNIGFSCVQRDNLVPLGNHKRFIHVIFIWQERSNSLKGYTITGIPSGACQKFIQIKR
jgi:hypothetical protein